MTPIIKTKRLPTTKHQSIKEEALANDPCPAASGRGPFTPFYPLTSVSPGIVPRSLCQRASYYPRSSISRIRHWLAASDRGPPLPTAKHKPEATINRWIRHATGLMYLIPYTGVGTFVPVSLETGSIKCYNAASGGG